MLFKRLLVHHDRFPASAAVNMATDEALLELSEQPVLRFYGWSRPSLSFGYFGRYADVAEEHDQRDIVRRWTGGGVVQHGEDLTYSLITPVHENAAAQGPPAIYASLHQAIRDSLLQEGRATELAEGAAPKISEACFANPVRHDLLFEGKKIAGAAQRRTRRGFLHQGSIQMPGLSSDFPDRLASALASQIQPEELPPAVRSRAALLASEKYATEAWLRRR